MTGAYKKKNMKTDVTQDYLEVQLSRKNLSNQTLLLRIGQLEELLGTATRRFADWSMAISGTNPLEVPLKWRFPES